MKLQDKLDAIKKGFQEQAPREVLDIMHRAVEDLKKSGILDQTVKVGDKAPDFTLNNTTGQAVTLSQLLAKGPLVVGFYRGRW
jgi:hypothetical protein